MQAMKCWFSVAILLCLLTPLSTGSRQGSGVIVRVSDGTPPTVTFEGDFASHFSGQRYAPWQFSLKMNPKWVYAVDGLVVPAERAWAALQPGRRVAWSEDCVAINTIDTHSHIGNLVGVNGDQIVLRRKMENAEQATDVQPAIEKRRLLLMGIRSFCTMRWTSFAK